MNNIFGDPQLHAAFDRMLQIGVLTVSFTKKDGTTRVMKATRNPAFAIPHQKKTDRVKKTNDNIVPVWDIEKSAWRSLSIEQGNNLHFLDWQRFSKAALEAEPGTIELEGALLD